MSHQTITTADLIPINPATLVADDWPDVDVFLRCEDDADPVLYFSSSDPSLRGQAERLKNTVGEKLFIKATDLGQYESYCRENWREIIARKDLSDINRVGVLGDIVRGVVKEEFNIGDAKSILQSSRELGNLTCNVIADCPLAVGQLLNVLHHDFGTFTHSTNVSIYCVLLARELGFSTAEQEEIAVGGLIHDLGKLHIDSAILNKPGRLTEQEYRAVREHPVIGYRELCREDATLGQLMMVYQHHEKIDGTGYPVGCTRDEIHVWARLCAVVDVYEALTSKRPYRHPASRESALAILNNGDGTHFDSEVLQCWRTILN